MTIIGYVMGLPVEERSATAHDPHTGQFTSGGGSSLPHADKLKLSKGNKSDAIGFLHTAKKPWGAHETEIEAALLSPGKKKVLLDHNGVILAAIAMQNEEGHHHVDHLGSMAKGGGTRLMKAAIQDAKKNKARLTLVPSNGSHGFYKKLGFEPTGRGDLWEYKGK